MQKKSFICLTIIIFSFTLLAEEITFDTNVKYKKNDTTDFIELKAQQPLTLKAGESAFINTDAGLPLLILSAANSKSKINIPNTQLSLVALEQSTPYLEKTTNELVDGLRRVDNLIGKRDYAVALTTITALKEKYKGLSSVLFLSGTANYLSNHKAAAIKDLEAGLLINSDNTSAKKLLEKIKKEL